MELHSAMFDNESYAKIPKKVYSNSTDDVRNEDLAKVELAVLSTIFALAVFGNSVVLVTLFSRWRRLSRMQLFIIHLSLADLFVAFCNVLPQLLWDFTYRFQGGNELCKFVKLIQVVAVYASAYVLVLTAVDRYNAICRPLTSHLWTTKRVHVMVVIAWVASFVFGIPQLFVFSYIEVKVDSGIYDCWATFHPDWMLQLYVTWFTTSVFFVPVTVLVVTYGFVCYHVWTRGRVIRTAESVPVRSPRLGHFKRCQTENNHQNSALLNTCYTLSSDCGSKINISRKSGLSKSKIRTFKLTFTVIVCFIICWAPFFIVQVWSAFDPTAPFTGPAMTIMALLASLNSCTNPWIYLAFSKNFCVKLKRKLSSRRSKLSAAPPAVSLTLLPTETSLKN